MPTQTEQDAHFMELALSQAERAVAGGQTPFGAVVVDREGALVGEGHNRVRVDLDPAAHGEIVAIRAAWRRLGAWSRLAGGTLYTSCEPCLLCSFVITQVGLGRVVFAARGTDVPTYRPLLGVDLTAAAAWVNRQADWPQLEVVGDFMRDRALAILAAFPWAQAAARAGGAPPAEASGDERWRRFRATFEAALAAQLDGRPAAFKALWSRRPDVSIFGALDGLELGWPEVDARLDWVSERVRAVDLRLENLRTTVGADLAVTVDLERMRRLVDGQPVPRVLRATQGYRLEDGEWRIFHRHADELQPSGRETP